MCTTRIHAKPRGLSIKGRSRPGHDDENEPGVIARIIHAPTYASLEVSRNGLLVRDWQTSSCRWAAIEKRASCGPCTRPIAACQVNDHFRGSSELKTTRWDGTLVTIWGKTGSFGFDFLQGHLYRLSFFLSLVLYRESVKSSWTKSRPVQAKLLQITGSLPVSAAAAV